MQRTLRPRRSVALTVAAVAEGATGLALLLEPALIVRWLLGPTVASSAFGRCFGIALIALAAACWPTRQRDDRQALRGMLLYNALLGGYLAVLRITTHEGGVLLWPAVAVHALIAVWLVVTSATVP